jgi:hypothetical protein
MLTERHTRKLIADGLRRAGFDVNGPGRGTEMEGSASGIRVLVRHSAWNRKGSIFGIVYAYDGRKLGKIIATFWVRGARFEMLNNKLLDYVLEREEQ